MGGIDPVSVRRQQLQAVENAKAQLASLQQRTTMTTECIRVLVEAGKESDREIGRVGHVEPDPLLIAICKVQLAQLRMSEAEGLAMIESLTDYIKRSESPLSMATLVPPVAGRH